MGFMAKLRARMAKKQRTVKVSWVGLDKAGKTTIIEKMKTGEFNANTKRTLGMTVEQFELKGKSLTFLSWDIGGQISFRSSLWEAYMAGSMGVIFVIDAADVDRLNEAKIEIWRYVLDNKNLNNVPILILANKQDLPTALPPGKIATALDLQKVRDTSFMILPTSAKTGFNLEEALEWLGQRISAQISRM